MHTRDHKQLVGTGQIMINELSYCSNYVLLFQYFRPHLLIVRARPYLEASFWDQVSTAGVMPKSVYHLVLYLDTVTNVVFSSPIGTTAIIVTPTSPTTR